MPVTCTSDSLATSAACFAGLSPIELESVKTYLLAVRAGVDPDPATLLQNAACFTGLSSEQLLAIQTYLLCQLANS